MAGAESAYFFAALQDYLERGIGEVAGWLWPTTASMIAELLVQQVSAAMRGDVCEIGVHHGRLFLILANAAVAAERAVAVDVFDDQDKNIDASGAGDRGILERHIAIYAPGAHCEIIQQSSLDLERHGFLSRRFRFMSIDGGHTAPVVVNDLRLAQATLLPAGVVALDDVLNHAWPGVVTGLSRYLAEGGTLVPFALVPNKLLLAVDETAAAWGRTVLRRHFLLALSKPDCEFLGGVVDCYVDHPYYDREASAGLRKERDAARMDLDAVRSELKDLRHRYDTLAASQVDADGLRKERDAATQQRQATEVELARSRAEISHLRASTSWQMTGPLRNLVSFTRRRRPI